jgi:hypothetical protein
MTCENKNTSDTDTYKVLTFTHNVTVDPLLIHRALKFTVSSLIPFTFTFITTLPNDTNTGELPIIKKPTQTLGNLHINQQLDKGSTQDRRDVGECPPLVRLLLSALHMNSSVRNSVNRLSHSLFHTCINPSWISSSLAISCEKKTTND